MIYSKTCHFARLIVCETITFRTYVQLYTGMAYKPGANTQEDIRKELEKIFPIVGASTQSNKKDGIIFRVKMMAYKLLSKTEKNLKLFEALDNILS
jgi:hypothetical protein